MKERIQYPMRMLFILMAAASVLTLIGRWAVTLPLDVLGAAGIGLAVGFGAALVWRVEEFRTPLLGGALGALALVFGFWIPGRFFIYLTGLIAGGVLGRYGIALCNMAFAFCGITVSRMEESGEE